MLKLFSDPPVLLFCVIDRSGDVSDDVMQTDGSDWIESEADDVIRQRLAVAERNSALASRVGGVTMFGQKHSLEQQPG